MRLELLWGSARRLILRTCRRQSVQRMRQTRQSDRPGTPHEVLDPLDCKFDVNQHGYRWTDQHDPFGERDRLPFVRAGLAKRLLASGFQPIVAGD